MTPDDEPRTTAPPRATALRRALAILGDPWTMLVLKEAFNGQRRFSGFQRALNIPRQTLSLRLTALCRDQMLYRRHVSADHATLEYAPHPKGAGPRSGHVCRLAVARGQPRPGRCPAL
jgi:DNA-binding HxlR family transcriptional regulator